MHKTHGKCDYYGSLTAAFHPQASPKWPSFHRLNMWFSGRTCSLMRLKYEEQMSSPAPVDARELTDHSRTTRSRRDKRWGRGDEELGENRGTLRATHISADGGRQIRRWPAKTARLISISATILIGLPLWENDSRPTGRQNYVNRIARWSVRTSSSGHFGLPEGHYPSAPSKSLSIYVTDPGFLRDVRIEQGLCRGSREMVCN